MAHGGGHYTIENKIIGGAYFKITSIAQATATIADRGVSAMALDLPWGETDKIVKVEAVDFLTGSMSVFGYDYSAPEMLPLRELFKHTKTAYIYRLNGNGEKASGTLCEAKFAGTRGNDIRYTVESTTDGYIVTHYIGTQKLGTQTVTSADELVDDDFVVWDKDASLAVTAGVNLSGGTNSTSTTSDHQAFLGKLERYPDCNSVGFYATTNTNLSTLNALYASWVINMRVNVGVRMVAVLSDYSADNESVVNVNGENGLAVVPWTIGVVAGMSVSQSATNMTYDGEVDVYVDFTQSELEEFLKAGKFTFHAVGDEVRVLEDINSFVSITDEKGEAFKDNQTIRINDAYCDAVASVFNSKYHGKVPNDNAGRVSLWGDIVKILNQLKELRAVETFEPKDIKVVQGATKKSVVVSDSYEVVNAMVRLYNNTTIR